MEQQVRNTITTQDLIRGLARAGYKKKAREIGKEYLDRKELKEILSSSSTGSGLLEDLVQIVKYIVKAKQKTICKFEDKYLILYAPLNENLLVEMINDNNHTFFIQPFQSDLSRLLGEFYGLEGEQVDSKTPYALKIDTNFYDQIHAMTKKELEHFIETEIDKLMEEERAKPIKEFLRDFKDNRQKASPIIFAYANRINFTEFFFPGKNYVWFIEYKNVRNDEVTIASTTSKQYLQLIEEHIRNFFTDYLNSKENRMVNKLFLFKRGVPFFIKSNILLIVFVLLLFINKSNWSYDSYLAVEINIFQSEIMILFLSFLACFRRKSALLKDIK